MFKMFKRKGRTAAALLGLCALCAVFAYCARPRMEGKLYVLMYHHLVESGENLNDWTVTTEHFRNDLQWLKDNGYTTFLPRELAQMEKLPEKSVLITFDDGYASNYYLAYPLLKEYDAKAVVAVIAKRIEDGKEDFLTWEMCRELTESGYMEIGSHSYDSHHMEHGIARMEGESRQEYEARVFTDLTQSISLIEAHTGAEVTYFAYPHGQTDKWAESFMKKHFKLTTTSAAGVGDVSRGLYLLPRYNVTMRNSLSDFLE